MDNFPHSSLTKPLTPEESQTLFVLSAQGDAAARERIIMAYLPKVIRISRSYEGKGVPLDDLIQEGTYGLILALDKFDPNRGTSFASFATHYIEKFLKKALIEQNSFQPIVYQEDFFYALQKYMRTLDEQKEQLNRTPSDQELAEALETTENKIRKMSQSLYSFFPVQDLFVGGNQQGSASAPHNTSAEDSMIRHVLDLSCLDIVLSGREKEVISRRLGFTDSGIPEDIASISADMGLSYETIRMTYEKTIHKIKEAAERLGYTVNTIEI